jgi:hypothetical protein
MSTMTKIAKLDRQLRRLVGMLAHPLALMEANELLDRRLELMAQRERGYTELDRRTWRR